MIRLLVVCEGPGQGSLAVPCTETETVPSSGVNLNAFERRLLRTFSIMSLSHQTSITSWSARTASVMPLMPAEDSKLIRDPFDERYDVHGRAP